MLKLVYFFEKEIFHTTKYPNLFQLKKHIEDN